MADAVTAGGVGQQALAVLQRGQRRFGALPPQRRTWLIAGMAMMAAVIAGMAWYGNRPDWRVLFSGLETKDAQIVSQELAAAGIPFQTTDDASGVQVPAELLGKARMEVAAKGMPQTGRMGFELFDKPNWVGSEFDEKVNYQRALEGELEHTIGSLGNVRSARVHLVMPAQSLFSQDQKTAKASVVLKLKRLDLGSEQAESIRRLVAGSVENLDAENVTLVDAEGRQNLQGNKGRIQKSDAEQAMEAKLVAMLEPLAGVGNVRTVVNATYDEGSEERTDEIYDPAQTATLSMEKTEQTSGAISKASGVPGTASNTAASVPASSTQGSMAAGASSMPPLLQGGKDGMPVYPERAGPTQTMKQESGTYGVTKHMVHREDAPGRVQRVTAAVLVNDRMTTEGEGKAAKSSWKPRSSEEMHRLEGLAQAAVGFDSKRGDQVTVENVSFSSNVPEIAPAGLHKVMNEASEVVREQPSLLRMGVLAMLGLLVVLFVLRPVARQMVATLKEPLRLAAPAPSRLELGAAQGSAALPGGSMRAAAAQETLSEAVIERITQHIRRKPEQSTRLLESWIDGQGEAN